MSTSTLYFCKVLKLYPLLILPFLVTGNYSYTQTGDSLIEYYSTLPLRESPYPHFQGVIRLSKTEALLRNHYRFTYDSQFRLRSISFWLGDRQRTPNHTANYFFTAPMQKIQYEDGKEIIRYFDRFGNPTTQRGAFQSVYSLDTEGRRVALHYEDEQGNPIENSWGIVRYAWTHLADGSVIEARYDLLGNPKSLRPHFEFYTIRLCYEANGLLALMQQVDNHGKLVENSTGVAQDKLLFDQQGRWLGWNVLDAQHQLKRGNGPNVAKGINQSNEHGYEASIRYEDAAGSAIMNSHGFWGSKRSYDRFGNYSHTQFIDSLGNPGLNEHSGYCYAVYTWDKAGYHLLKIALQDVNRQPIEHKTRGYAFVSYEYNEWGQRSKTTYLGMNGEKINRKDNGVCSILYEYDEHHKAIGNRRYTLEGKRLD